jgi:hypothetical protein
MRISRYYDRFGLLGGLRLALLRSVDGVAVFLNDLLSFLERLGHIVMEVKDLVPQLWKYTDGCSGKRERELLALHSLPCHALLGHNSEVAIRAVNATPHTGLSNSRTAARTIEAGPR